MKIVKPSFEILTPIDRPAILTLLEAAGRVCYKSEDKITHESAGPFVEKLGKVFKHESILEHAGFSVRFICDRGVTHELVRHRLAAYSQESTRYCNYCANKFNGDIILIHPDGLQDYQLKRREDHFWNVQRLYDLEISEGVSPQIARGILPNALKTEIVMTANLREWKHVFKLRCNEKAHPQIREIMIPLHAYMVSILPEIFG